MSDKPQSVHALKPGTRRTPACGSPGYDVTTKADEITCYRTACRRSKTLPAYNGLPRRVALPILKATDTECNTDAGSCRFLRVSPGKVDCIAFKQRLTLRADEYAQRLPDCKAAEL
jgi:hypothetical protein